MVEERVLPFDINEITQIEWLRFAKEIVSNRLI